MINLDNAEITVRRPCRGATDFDDGYWWIMADDYYLVAKTAKKTHADHIALALATYQAKAGKQ